MRNWYLQELYDAALPTTKAKKVCAAFANAVSFMIYFLPPGAHIRLKPKNSNLQEYQAWVQELYSLTEEAELRALQFCDKHRNAADEADADADDDSEVEGPVHAPHCGKKRKRGITAAFHGLHKRLSAIYCKNPDLFVEAPGVVVDGGRLSLQDEH